MVCIIIAVVIYIYGFYLLNTSNVDFKNYAMLVTTKKSSQTLKQSVVFRHTALPKETYFHRKCSIPKRNEKFAILRRNTTFVTNRSILQRNINVVAKFCHKIL